MSRALALAVALLAATAATAQDLDDLLLEMQMVVLDGREPPPFTLETLDDGPASLAEFRGRVVLLYFWQSG